MSPDHVSPTRLAMRFSVFALVIGLLLSPIFLFGQATVGTGSIVGTVTDQSGAVVSGAKVTIANAATGQTVDLTTNSAGAFNSGALIPGSYKVQISSKGFSTLSTTSTVLVGNTSTVNAKLQLGQESQTVEVQAAEIAVNTEQATVQGVLNAQQIENLPVNGRNFLDLAQLEPGVQIQEGSTFDPTKNGFSSISFGGRFGRTARVEVDGVDVSDETVGTTTQNIPASAIQEFQLSQSSLDMSTELTSSGSVNVVTRSGTNQVHGQLFGNYRNSAVGTAALPGGSKVPWFREQFGGNFGGAIIKDKLFYFVDAERNRQDLPNPVLFQGPFVAASANVGEPFREIMTTNRLDYQIGNGAKAFYRFSYDQNSDIRPFGSGPSAQPFKNRNNTGSHAIGLDFNTGAFTHAVRFEYLKFRNGIVDGASEVTGAANPLPNVAINIGGGALFDCQPGSLFCSGPNFLAPQQTYQSNHQ
ncbi:MAG TPA: TonB-dependent receptor, partial [Terriglobales bacterium]|nr:TonB-dependent receptor [Terriglobales bacterium]